MHSRVVLNYWYIGISSYKTYEFIRCVSLPSDHKKTVITLDHIDAKDIERTAPQVGQNEGATDAISSTSKKSSIESGMGLH